MDIVRSTPAERHRGIDMFRIVDDKIILKDAYRKSY